MPWLEKGCTSTPNVAHAPAPNTQLLFVHIPRCGGTSLMKAHGLQEKILTGPDCPWYKQLFLKIFFSRYETFEKVNFPIWTQLNAGCLVLGVTGAIWLHLIDHGTQHYNATLPTQVWYRMFAITLIAASTIIFVIFTYVLNAPTIARIRCIRRAFLLLNEYLLCQVMADREYITGVNIDGYLPHLTANKLLGLSHHTPSSQTITTTAGNNPYVSIKTWQNVATFAIVRNPYARMVSVYMYNRFGPWETFPHFVRSWYRSTSQAYRRDHQVHDWYVPNHALPQFEYTHSTTCLEDNDDDEDNNGINNNKDDHGQPLYQLVQSIIKLEDLKYLNKNRKNKTTNRNTVKNTAIDASGGGGSSSLSSDEHEDENDGSNDIILVDESQDDTTVQAQRKTPAYRHTHSKSSSTATSTSTESSSGSGSGNGRSLQNLPEVVYEALANMPHDNSRKTDVPWYDLYDQETLALVYEMYARDFEVFEYDRELPHRPDLHRPTNIRQRRGLGLSKPSAACSTITTSSTKKPDDESLLLSSSSSHKDNDDSGQEDVNGNDADSTDDCWYPGYYASKIFHLRQRRRCSDAGGSNVSSSLQQLQQQQQKYTSVFNGDDNIWEILRQNKQIQINVKRTKWLRRKNKERKPHARTKHVTIYT